MSKFVIAGRSDCPYYAKSELLADKLQAQLPEFSIHKESINAENWSSWLGENCQKFGFQWNKSPVIWRELTERGGSGSLLGGYNEFCEYAKMYYNLEYEISSVLAKEIGEENTLLKIKTENEKRKRKEQEKPLNITVTNTTSPLAYQLLAAILKKNSVFDAEFLKDGIAINSVGETDELTKGILMELEDLAEGNLREVKMYNNLDDCIQKTNLFLILDENNKPDEISKIEWINSLREKYKAYGKKLKNYKGRVFISGQFATFAASLIIRSAETLSTSQILTTAAANENMGRGCFGRKLSLNASKIHNILYYGASIDVQQMSLISTHAITVQGVESAIVGSDWYHRGLDEVLFDTNWKNSLFDTERRANKIGPMTEASSIVKVLNFWFSNKDSNEIVSCGTRPSAQSALTSSYICLPGKFSNGEFMQLDLNLPETDKVKLIEVDQILKRDEDLSTLSEDEQWQFIEDEKMDLQRIEAEEKLENEMIGPIITDTIAEVPEEEVS